MQRYLNNVQDIFGNAIAGVSVSVLLNGTSTPATLYSDNGVTPKANPFTNDDDGTITFYCANGRVDIVLTKSGITFDPADTRDIAMQDPASAVLSQIAFPAVQVPSANVNTLDDYEEGSWTPSLGGTTTYSLQAGRYIKIGKLVHVWCQVNVTLIGTGSTRTISGLPFPVAAGFNTVGFGSMYFSGLINNVVYVVPIAQGSQIDLSSLVAAGASVGTTALFGNGTQFLIGMAYETDN
jgi:hypothetical protein